MNNVPKRKQSDYTVGSLEFGAADRYSVSFGSGASSWLLREAFLAGVSWVREQRRNKAREVLSEWRGLEYDLASLHCLGQYVDVIFDEDTITLDGEFTADELEAIACWMREPFGKGETT
jgi:hypothetical protein